MSLLFFISKRNLSVPRMWLANPHSILQRGFSLSRAKAVFIPPSKLVFVARSSYPAQKSPGFLLWKPGRFVYFMGAFSGTQYLSTGIQFFEVLVISVFRGLSVHLSERFFQTDYRFFDDLCLIGRAICKLFGHPAVEHRLCFFDLDAQQLVR